MSDRPMRLKYLTKMKIILCIFLLCITAVSVFGEPQELNGIVGESVKFPAAVKIDGNLRYSGLTIGTVTSGRFTAASNVEYSDRVQWDSSTGLLSLSELRLKDSGIYTVQDTQQTSVSTFNLTVWEGNVPVSKPHVIIHYESCTIECTAERGTEATLSWYREGEKKPFVSSRVASAPYLHLPETVERSGTYTCEAKNSVSNEKTSITVGAHCAAGLSTGTIVAIVIAVLIVVLIAVVLAVLYCRIRSKNAGTRSELEGTRKELEGIRSKNADTRSELEGTRTELEGTRKELEGIRKELEGTRTDHAGTRSQLVDTRSELEVVRSSFIKAIHGLAEGTDVPNKEDYNLIKPENV